jgi:hypothetical protein
MLNVIAAGYQSGTGDITLNKSTGMLKLMADGGTAVVVLNGVSITLHHGSKDFQDFPGDYPSWSVTSGNVYWVAFG